MIGGGASNSGGYMIPDISSAWSPKDSGGRCGGASGCVLAARSVAIRSSRVSVPIRLYQYFDDVSNKCAYEVVEDHDDLKLMA